LEGEDPIAARLVFTEIDEQEMVLESLAAHVNKGWGLKDRKEHHEMFRDSSTMQSQSHLPGLLVWHSWQQVQGHECHQG
jgi:hypothetical protein